MQRYNILLSGVGRRVSLVRHFQKTLKSIQPEGQVHAADSSKTAAAAFVADVYHRVPPTSEPGYVDAMLTLCRQHNIRLLFPLIDSELTILANSTESFLSAGTRVVVSSPDATQICADKRLTQEYLSRHGITTPRLLDLRQSSDKERIKFPVIVKPYDGSRSIGVNLVHSHAELDFFLQHTPHAIVQEFADGAEYTVDVLVGFDGAIGCVVPRRRIEVRAGEVSKGVTTRSRDIADICRKVVEAMPGLVGCITVQCFKDDEGQIKIIEINPRFGGGFPLSLHAGADFPRWLIEQDLTGMPTVWRDDWTDNLAMLRYDDEVIVDGTQIAEC